MIYRTLAGLNAEGLVDMEVIERDERLDMKLYHITEAGRNKLHRWLSTPLPPQDYREPFLIQVYFAGKLSDEEIDALLQHEIQAIEERLAIYDAIYKMYQERINASDEPRSLFLSVSTLEYGILSNRVSLEWLKSLAGRVKSGDYTLKNFRNQ